MAIHLSKAIIQQPKSCFDVPLAKWLRNDLKDWVQQYYADNNIGGPGGDIDWEARQYWLTEGKKSGEAEAKRIIRELAYNFDTDGHE